MSGEAVPRDTTAANYCPEWCESYRADLEDRGEYHDGDHGRALGSAHGEPGDVAEFVTVALAVPERSAHVRFARARVEVTASGGIEAWTLSPSQARSLARLLSLAADVAETYPGALWSLGAER